MRHLTPRIIQRKSAKAYAVSAMPAAQTACAV
jgi:hypothetical protein